MRSIHSDTNPLHQRTRTRPVYDIPTGCVCFDGRNSGPESCCTLRKMFAWWVSNTDFIYISRDRSNTQHAARSTCTHTHRHLLIQSLLRKHTGEQLPSLPLGSTHDSWEVLVPSVNPTVPWAVVRRGNITVIVQVEGRCRSVEAGR